MSDRLKALREQRGVIVTSMRALTDKAEAEKRDLSAEEVGQHLTLWNESEAKRTQIEIEERTLDAERQDASRRAEAEDARRAREGGGGAADGGAELRMSAFRKYFLTGLRGLTPEESRALQVTPDTSGGYLLAPQEFVATLIKTLDNLVFVRGLSTVLQAVNANGLGAPSLDNDPADIDWTTELLTGSEDSTMSFGKRELKPNPMAKLIKVSKQLLRTAAMPVDEIVRQRIAYKVAVTQEKAYLTGSGNNQPLGVFTASNDGISTGRDFSTNNTTTTVTFDGLIGAKWSLKAAYWSRAQWIFHRDVGAQISKLKDGEGQYIWRESARAGEPDMLLGRPINISEYAPNTFTTGLYVGIIGDFSHYWIADLLDLQIQQLVELYAATNQDGYICRYEGDGMPVLEEAFARVKLA
jgi:HK97 family phage major capsid protein